MLQRTGDMHAPAIDRREALAVVVEEFAASIAERREPATGVAAALRVVAMAEAAARSLREDGRRIPL